MTFLNCEQELSCTAVCYHNKRRIRCHKRSAPFFHLLSFTFSSQPIPAAIGSAMETAGT